jgi:hypothetical protein
MNVALTFKMMMVLGYCIPAYAVNKAECTGALLHQFGYTALSKKVNSLYSNTS